jgi:hypothetical protein
LTAGTPILKSSEARFVVALPNVLYGAQAIPRDGRNLTQRGVALQQPDHLPMTLLYIRARPGSIGWRFSGWNKGLLVSWFWHDYTITWLLFIPTRVL